MDDDATRRLRNEERRVDALRAGLEGPVRNDDDDYDDDDEAEDEDEDDAGDAEFVDPDAPPAEGAAAKGRVAVSFLRLGRVGFATYFEPVVRTDGTVVEGAETVCRLTPNEYDAGNMIESAPDLFRNHAVRNIVLQACEAWSLSLKAREPFVAHESPARAFCTSRRDTAELLGISLEGTAARDGSRPDRLCVGVLDEGVLALLGEDLKGLRALVRSLDAGESVDVAIFNEFPVFLPDERPAEFRTQREMRGWSRRTGRRWIRVHGGRQMPGVPDCWRVVNTGKIPKPRPAKAAPPPIPFGRADLTAAWNALADRLGDAKTWVDPTFGEALDGLRRTIAMTVERFAVDDYAEIPEVAALLRKLAALDPEVRASLPTDGDIPPRLKGKKDERQVWLARLRGTAEAAPFDLRLALWRALLARAEGFVGRGRKTLRLRTAGVDPRTAELFGVSTGESRP
jgi:hypothetical protein